MTDEEEAMARRVAETKCESTNARIHRLEDVRTGLITILEDDVQQEIVSRGSHATRTEMLMLVQALAQIEASIVALKNSEYP